MLPTIGRIVLFRIGGTDEHPVLRPSTVVNVDGSGEHVNLKVELDPFNDEALVVALVNGRPRETNMLCVEITPAMLWEVDLRAGASERFAPHPTAIYASSCPKGEGLGEWRWPPRA